MYIYVNKNNEIIAASEVKLNIPDTQVFEVDNVPEPIEIYEFKNGKFNLNLQKKAEFDAQLKNIEVNKKYIKFDKYILENYPQVKQNSDIADKLYFEMKLKSKNIDISKIIFDGIESFYNGEKFEDILNDIKTKNNFDDEIVDEIAQVLKAMIRLEWLQKCKKELKDSINENREMDLLPFPIIEY